MQQQKDKLFDELMEGYLSGSLSEAQQEALFSLIGKSGEYEELYKERMKLYALLHVPVLEAEKKEKVTQLSNRLKAAGSRSTYSLFFYMRAVAAAILLMIVSSYGSVYLYQHFSGEESSGLYETVVPLGSQTKVNLPDGTVVHLNAGTVFQYPLSFGKKQRDVYLKGEGYFEVAKDTKKEFRVHVDDLQVKVTGTKFNVRSYPENASVEVTLMEGGVDVQAAGRNIRLQPDQKVVYTQETGLMAKIDIESYKAALWTTGRLSFVNSSLVDILKEIERKYSVKIHVESESARKEFFSAMINLEMSLEEVFAYIDVDKKYLFEQRSGVITVKDRS